MVTGWQAGLGWAMGIALVLLLVVFAGLARHVLAMTLGASVRADAAATVDPAGTWPTRVQPHRTWSLRRRAAGAGPAGAGRRGRAGLPRSPAGRDLGCRGLCVGGCPVNRLRPPSTQVVDRDDLLATSPTPARRRLAPRPGRRPRRSRRAARGATPGCAPAASRHELIVHIPRDDPRIPTLAARILPRGSVRAGAARPVRHPPRRASAAARGWSATGTGRRADYPMRHDADPDPRFEPDVGSFPFIPVQGDGVYEIPVGPIHAGLIEPGHFRFSVVGETILRMKARLWFLHRGVEKLFEGRAARRRHRAGRADQRGHRRRAQPLAYVHGRRGRRSASRSIRATSPRERSCSRLERLHNHVADLGAIANDVGYGIANAHTQRLREMLLRHNKALTGHRLLRGGITIGGARLRAAPGPRPAAATWPREVAEIADIALDHSVVRRPVHRHRGAQPGSRPRSSAPSATSPAPPASPSTRGPTIRCSTWRGFAPVVEQAGDVLARFTGPGPRGRQPRAALIADLARDGSSARVGEPGAAASPRAGRRRARASWRPGAGTLCHRVETRTRRAR